MATKRKAKKTAPRKAAAAAPATTKAKRKPRKRKAATKRAASGAFTSSKRTRKPMQLVLKIEDVPINSPALRRLTDSQRVDLAAMDARRRTLATRPAWALDESIWRRAVRTVSPNWTKLRNPWPTVAWVYLHIDGPVGEGRRGLLERDQNSAGSRSSKKHNPNTKRIQQSFSSEHEEADDEPQSAPSRSEQLNVERVHVDETGVDESGNYRGRGTWWRVFNASLDSVVRAASSGAARAIGARMLRAQ